MAINELGYPILEGFDPLSPEFLADPVPWVHRAQQECPVFYYPGLNIWVVTRYEDICMVARDHETFSSRALSMIPPPDDLADRVPKDFVGEHFVAIDPPEHTASRGAVAKFFLPAEINKQADAIRDIANELVDTFIERGACDIMQDYCYPLSLRVIIRLLGIPPERYSDYRQWTEDLFAIFTPKTEDGSVKPMSETERRQRWERLIAGSDFFSELVEQRRAHPQNDLVTAMLQAKDGEDRQAIPTSRIIRHINELVAAGNDTTANLMGHMIQFFDRDPAQFDEVKCDPALLVNAVEEALRRRGSSPGLFRIATRDVEVAGTRIPKNALIWVLYIGGGLDESRFSDSEKFDIHRKNANRHLAFGHGRHSCLGNPLARLEARLGLEVLFTRIPDIRVAPGQTLHYQPVMTVLTLDSLRVEWGRGVK
jgi:cytochrome P450